MIKLSLGERDKLKVLVSKSTARAARVPLHAKARQFVDIANIQFSLTVSNGTLPIPKSLETFEQEIAM